MEIINKIQGKGIHALIYHFPKRARWEYHVVFVNEPYQYGNYCHTIYFNDYDEAMDWTNKYLNLN